MRDYRWRSHALMVLAICVSASHAAAQTDVTTAGVPSDGTTDATAAIQQLLDDGATDLYFPRGAYLLGTVSVPADSRLDFAPGARLRVNPTGLVPVTYTWAGSEQTVKALFHLTGSGITIRGADFDIPVVRDTRNLVLFFGHGVSGLRFEQLRVLNPVEGETSLARLKELDVELPRGQRFRGSFIKPKPVVVRMFDCRDITLTGARAFNILHFIEAFRCENVSMHGNRLEVGNTITTFHAGSRGLRHYDNWSRKVVYQCVFRGGSPDPSRKAPRVPLGSSATVHRNLGPEDEGYNRNTAGTYDIAITNNYAEYGRTLAWGNKGRQVTIEGNTARFMNDYSYTGKNTSTGKCRAPA